MRIFGEFLVVIGVFILAGIFFPVDMPTRAYLFGFSLAFIIPGWWLWQHKKKE